MSMRAFRLQTTPHGHCKDGASIIVRAVQSRNRTIVSMLIKHGARMTKDALRARAAIETLEISRLSDNAWKPAHCSSYECLLQILRRFKTPHVLHQAFFGNSMRESSPTALAESLMGSGFSLDRDFIGAALEQ